MTIDYIGLTTHEIFQTREILINWARKDGKSHGFMIVIKKSYAPKSKKGRIFLSCEHSETYKIHSSIKIHDKDKSNQQQSRRTGTKKMLLSFTTEGQAVILRRMVGAFG